MKTELQQAIQKSIENNTDISKLVTKQKFCLLEVFNTLTKKFRYPENAQPLKELKSFLDTYPSQKVVALIQKATTKEEVDFLFINMNKKVYSSIYFMQLYKNNVDFNKLDLIQPFTRKNFKAFKINANKDIITNIFSNFHNNIEELDTLFFALFSFNNFDSMNIKSFNDKEYNRALFHKVNNFKSNNKREFIFNGLLGNSEMGDDSGVSITPFVVSKKLSGEEICSKLAPIVLAHWADNNIYGRKIDCRYAISNQPIEDPQEFMEDYTSIMMGAVKSEFSGTYSDMTGHLFTNEKFVVGGHDVIKELSGQLGKYIHMEITIY